MPGRRHAGQPGPRMRHGVEIHYGGPGFRGATRLLGLLVTGSNSGWSYIGGPADPPLPISLDAVKQDRNLARGVLCDYCFFGGPTKTQLQFRFSISGDPGLTLDQALIRLEIPLRRNHSI